MMNIAAILRMARRPAPTPELPQTLEQIPGATPGCYAMVLGDEDYHRKAPGVSSTGLKRLLRSPAHYQAYLQEPKNDTASQRLGRAIHAWVLEQGTFDERFAVWRGGHRRGKVYEDFAHANSGRTVLSEQEMRQVQGAGHALLNNSAFPMRGFLEGVRDDQGVFQVEPARTEFSIFWTDEETGVQCKVRLDALRLAAPVLALDIKSTDDARPHAFTRQMIQLDYDLQAAFYVEGVRRFTGCECPFLFAAVEVDPPYGVVFYGMSPQHDLMVNGRRKFSHALRLKAQCDRTGQYPGYEISSVLEPQMAPWMAFEPPALAA